MTTLQRRILATVASLGFLLTTVLVLTGGAGGDGERLAVEAGPAKTTTTTTTTTSTTADEAATSEAESAETTVPLVPLTTGVPIPNADQAPPPTRPPSATPGVPRTAGESTGASATGAAKVGPEGAVLTRPSDTSTTRPVDKAKGCHSANDPGWRVEECGALRSGGTVLLWLVESRGGGTRTLVLREQTAGRWAVVLAAKDDSGSLFSSVGVRGEDVSGDGQPELVFGFHRRGGQRVLAVDVVDASPAVVVHRELAQGTARAAKGRLDTWAAAGDGFDHVVIRFADGAWRASPPQRVARGDVPPGMV